MEILNPTPTCRGGSLTALAPPTADVAIRYQASGVRLSRDNRGNCVRATGTPRPTTPSFPRKRESTADHKWSVPEGGSYRTLGIGLVFQ
jgi:hypothetical protein